MAGQTCGAMHLVFITNINSLESFSTLFRVFSRASFDDDDIPVVVVISIYTTSANVRLMRHAVSKMRCEHSLDCTRIGRAGNVHV